MRPIPRSYLRMLAVVPGSARVSRRVLDRGIVDMIGNRIVCPGKHAKIVEIADAEYRVRNGVERHDEIRQRPHDGRLYPIGSRGFLPSVVEHKGIANQFRPCEDRM